LNLFGAGLFEAEGVDEGVLEKVNTPDENKLEELLSGIVGLLKLNPILVFGRAGAVIGLLATGPGIPILAKLLSTPKENDGGAEVVGGTLFVPNENPVLITLSFFKSNAVVIFFNASF